MRHLIGAILVVLAMAIPARANEDIRGVISAQIDAFQMDDFRTAFTYASPNIRRIFGTAERFGQMVQQGYPMVWRPSEVKFLSIEERQDGLWQSVLMRDAGGAPHVLEYQMIQTEQGGWLINAVRLLRGQDGLV